MARTQTPRAASLEARAWTVAATAVAVLAACYVAFVRTQIGQRLDQSALNSVSRSDNVGSAVATVVQDITVGCFAVVAVGCLVVAAVRRRWAPAAAAVVLVGGALGSTELLKHGILARPDLGYGTSNTLPSGHTTVVASLALAALLVVPPGGRWITGLAGSVGVTITGVGTVVAGWHRPSDVLAALAVTLAWGAGVLAVLARERVTPSIVRPTTRTTALAFGLAGAAAVFLALGVRSTGSPRDLAAHVVTMCGLGLVGAAVVGLFGRMVDSRVR